MTEDQRALVIGWFNSLEEAKKAKAIVEAEQAMRKEVIKICFPNPKEGTNHFDLGDGYVLTLNYKIDRKLDDAAFLAQKEVLRTTYQVDPNSVVTYSPSLSTSGFKSLKTTNDAAYQFMQQFVTEKPGSHSLELKPPKTA